MDRKLIIMGVLIIALSAYIFMSKMGGSGSAVDLGEWKGPIDRITIESADKKIDLTARDGKWFLGEKLYPADPQAVSDIEKNMTDIKIADLISDQEYYNSYDLHDEKKTVVTLYQDGAEVRKISFGKQGSTRQHTYVRIADKKSVYLAEGIYDSILTKTIDSLRSKEIVKLDKAALSAFDLRYKGRLISLIKKTEDAAPEKEDSAKSQEKKPADIKTEPVTPPTDKWVLASSPDTALNQAKTDTLLSVINPLTAAAFMSDEAAMTGSPICEITAVSGEKKFQLNIFEKEKDSNRYPALSSESPYMFYIEEWKAKKLFIEKPEDLKDGK